MRAGLVYAEPDEGGSRALRPTAQLLTTRAGFPGPGLRSQPCYLATRSGEPTLTREELGCGSRGEGWRGADGKEGERELRAGRRGTPPSASRAALGRGSGLDAASSWFGEGKRHGPGGDGEVGGGTWHNDARSPAPRRSSRWRRRGPGDWASIGARGEEPCPCGSVANVAGGCVGVSHASTHVVHRGSGDAGEGGTSSSLWSPSLLPGHFALALIASSSGKHSRLAPCSELLLAS